MKRSDGTDLATNTVVRHLFQSLAAYDGAEDFGGPSGVLANTAVGASTGINDSLISTADFAAFLGATTVTVPVASQGRTDLNGPGNLDISAALEAGATVTVNYYYVAGAPATLSFPAGGGTLSVPTAPIGQLIGARTPATGVAGFAAGDTIDLPGVAYNANTRAALGANNGLAVSSGDNGAALWFQQAGFTGNQLHLSADAAGTGTAITLDSSGLAVQGGAPDVVSDYVGPVADLQHQYVAINAQTLVAATGSDNWFLHGTSGTDALAAHGGRNVIDGGTGSNFLTGGSGTDTFFVSVARGAATWSTIANAHAGDDITLWNVAPGNTITWQDDLGAPGYTGLTLTVFDGSNTTTHATLVGYSTADLTNGRLGTSLSTGTPYFHIAIQG